MLTLFRVMTFEDWTDVMNEEHERILKEEAIEPTIADLQKQLAEIKELLNNRAN